MSASFSFSCIFFFFLGTRSRQKMFRGEYTHSFSATGSFWFPSEGTADITFGTSSTPTHGHKRRVAAVRSSQNNQFVAEVLQRCAHSLLAPSRIIIEYPKMERHSMAPPIRTTLRIIPVNAISGDSISFPKFGVSQTPFSSNKLRTPVFFVSDEVTNVAAASATAS